MIPTQIPQPRPEMPLPPGMTPIAPAVTQTALGDSGFSALTGLIAAWSQAANPPAALPGGMPEAGAAPGDPLTQWLADQAGLSGEVDASAILDPSIAALDAALPQVPAAPAAAPPILPMAVQEAEPVTPEAAAPPPAEGPVHPVAVEAPRPEPQKTGPGVAAQPLRAEDKDAVPIAPRILPAEAEPIPARPEAPAAAPLPRADMVAMPPVTAPPTAQPDPEGDAVMESVEAPLAKAPNQTQSAGLSPAAAAPARPLVAGADAPPVESGPSEPAQEASSRAEAPRAAFTQADAARPLPATAEALPPAAPDEAAALPRAESADRTGAVSRPSVTPSTPDPRPVLQQVTDALVTSRADRTEVALSPEELGRVRLIFAGPDRSHVIIWAERPETLDLVRRNADLLAQQMQDAGLSGGSMEFRQDDSPRPGRASGDPDRRAEGEGPAVTPVALSPRALSDRRIDIRI